MKKLANVLVLLLAVQFHYLHGQNLDRPTPFALVLKDKNIIVPNSVCSNIETGKVSVHFTINSCAVLIDFKIIELKLISKSKNIDFVNEHFLTDTKKNLPFDVQQFIPLIKSKMAELKIIKNKYGKPKKINYGTIRLNLINEKGEH